MSHFFIKNENLVKIRKFYSGFFLNVIHEIGTKPQTKSSVVQMEDI